MTFRTVTDLSGRAARLGARQGVRLARAGAGAAARRVVPLPDVQVAPRGRMVDLGDRGRTYVSTFRGRRRTPPCWCCCTRWA